MMHQHNVGRRVERFTLFHDPFAHQQLFNGDQSTLGQVHLARFFIDGEVAFTLEGVGIFFFLTNQMRNDFVYFDIEFRAVFSRTGDD